MGRPKTGNPPGRPQGLYGPDVMAVVKMEPDRIVHKNGHTVEVVS